METAASVPSGDQKNKIWQILEQEPHRAFGSQTLATTLKPGGIKDPQQQQQIINEIMADLSKLVKEGMAREVADGLFKARLFTNETKHIEHAFIGGMGNTLFRFRSPIFRLNIGVISMFFMKNQKEGVWTVLVRDTTAGVSYCLRLRLKDGTYRFGSEAEATDEKGYIPIVGRYIEAQHVTMTLRGEDILVEDLKTGRGSRVDLLTEQGLAQYRRAVDEFLKMVDASRLWDPVTRGRYVLDQLLQHKQNLEVTFFGATVDSVLIQKNA
jgi:hypothetical protein